MHSFIFFFWVRIILFLTSSRPLMYFQFYGFFHRGKVVPRNKIESHRRQGVNFINVKCANFKYERLFSRYALALNKLSYEKCMQKVLMKLSPVLDEHNQFHFKVVLIFHLLLICSLPNLNVSAIWRFCTFFSIWI